MPSHATLFLVGNVLRAFVSMGHQDPHAQVIVSPINGPPGSFVYVSGTGFGPVEHVEIRFDGFLKATALTDANGSLRRAILVPGSAGPGLYLVTAKGRDSGLGDAALFTVETDWTHDTFGPRRTEPNPLGFLVPAGRRAA
jgi:hypothetical protein